MRETASCGVGNNAFTWTVDSAVASTVRLADPADAPLGQRTQPVPSLGPGAHDSGSNPPTRLRPAGVRRCTKRSPRWWTPVAAWSKSTWPRCSRSAAVASDRKTPRASDSTNEPARLRGRTRHEPFMPNRAAVPAAANGRLHAQMHSGVGQLPGEPGSASVAGPAGAVPGGPSWRLSPAATRTATRRECRRPTKRPPGATTPSLGTRQRPCTTRRSRACHTGVAAIGVARVLVTRW
jgi:hypothetical protein